MDKLALVIERWHGKWVDNNDGLFNEDYKDLRLAILNWFE